VDEPTDGVRVELVRTDLVGHGPAHAEQSTGLEGVKQTVRRLQGASVAFGSRSRTRSIIFGVSVEGPAISTLVSALGGRRWALGASLLRRSAGVAMSDREALPSAYGP
jgi:hypothetical protein